MAAATVAEFPLKTKDKNTFHAHGTPMMSVRKRSVPLFT
jgi:hypothetical protein